MLYGDPRRFLFGDPGERERRRRDEGLGDRREPRFGDRCDDSFGAGERCVPAGVTERDRERRDFEFAFGGGDRRSLLRFAGELGLRLGDCLVGLLERAFTAADGVTERDDLRCSCLLRVGETLLRLSA